MIKKYNYSNIISKEDHKKAKKLIDNLFKSGNYCHFQNVPKYQTWLDLYKYEEMNIFVSTFIDACRLYLDSEINYCNYLYFWCYMDYRSNFLKKDYDDQWHTHTNSGSHTISGLYYMINPRNVGTEFRDFYIEKPEPYTWYLYPPHLEHRPPKVLSYRKRYTLGIDISVSHKIE